MAGRFPRRISHAGLVDRNAQRAATIFYVDPAGSDAADGLSTGTAWQTVAKVNAGGFVPGDQILFKLGGTWRGTTLTPPSAGVPGSPITFGSYGTGAKPILSGGSVVTGWSVFSGSTYSAALTTAPTYVVAGSTALTKGSGSGSLTANQWFWASNVLYVHLGGTNPSSTTVEAATNDIVVNLDTKDYVTFSGLDFRFGADRTIRGNAANHFIFTGCNWQWCSTRSNGGVVSLGGCGNGRITACTWDQLLNDGIWFHNCPNLEIDNFTMTNVGHLVGDAASDGIQLDDASFGTGLDSSGLWIHDGTITMSPNSPKGGILLVADPSIATSGGVVERVTVNGGNFGAAPSASNFTIRDCKFLDQISTYGGGFHVDTVAWTISNVVLTRNLVARSSRSGIVFQTTSSHRSNWTIVNNTFVDCAFFPFIQDAPLSGLVEDNIFWYTGSAPVGMLYTAGGVVSAETLTWDYNVVRDPGTGTPFTGPTGTTYATFAAWKSGTSRDAHSLTSDPLFTNAGAGDYTLTPSSPAINAGVAVPGIGQIVNGAAPDIGYFEALVVTAISCAATQAQSAACARQAGHISAATQAQLSAAIRRANRTSAATQAQSASAKRNPAHIVATTQAQVPVVIRSIPRSSSTTQAQVAATSRTPGRKPAATQAQSATTTRSTGRIAAATQAQAAATTRSVLRIVGTTQAQVAACAKFKAVLMACAATQAQAASALRSVARLITSTQPQVAAQSRRPGRISAATQAQSSSLARTVAHAPAATQAQAAACVKIKVALITCSATQPQVATVSHSVSHTAAATQPQLAATMRSIARKTAATQAQVAASRRTANHSSATTQAQVVTTRRSPARVIAATQAQSATVARSTPRLIVATQAQLVAVSVSTGSAFKGYGSATSGRAMAGAATSGRAYSGKADSS